MRLTWKDATAALLIGAIVAVYVAFLNGTSLWLISSARGTTAAVLVLGTAGCAMRDLHAPGRSRSARVFLAVATALGVVALVAELIGLITGSTVALAVLVAGTIALWLIATVRHASTIRTEPGSGRDVHEASTPRRRCRIDRKL